MTALRRRYVPWLALWYGIPATIVAVGVLVPLAYLLFRAFWGDLAPVMQLVWRARTAWLLINTATLAAGVLVIGTCIAFPLAWLTTRSNMPARALVTLLAVLPLAIPGYVMAYALLAATGARGTFMHLLGLSLPRVTGYTGALIALSLCTYPYLFLNLRAALRGLDPSLEESARALGYTPPRVFWHVTLPQLRPAFQAAALLVGLHVLGDFGVVSLMQFKTFSYALHVGMQSAFLPEGRMYIAWLGLMMLALTGGVLFVEARMLRGLALHRLGSGAARTRRTVRLGKWMPAAIAFVGLIALLGIIAPLTTIGDWMLRGGIGDWGGRLMDVGAALYSSLVVSAPAALVAMLLALPLVYRSVRKPSRRSRLLERTAYFGYATPPLAFALAVIFFVLLNATGLEKAGDWVEAHVWGVLGSALAAPLQWMSQMFKYLYQSLPLLVIVYSMHFLAEAIGPLRSAVYQAPPRMEESARSLGTGPIKTFFRVTLPLIRGGIFTALLLVFLSAMKELPLTIMLQPPDFHTLATNVWDKTGEYLFAEAAPYALTIVIVSAVFVLALLGYSRHGQTAAA